MWKAVYKLHFVISMYVYGEHTGFVSSIASSIHPKSWKLSVTATAEGCCVPVFYAFICDGLKLELSWFSFFLDTYWWQNLTYKNDAQQEMSNTKYKQSMCASVMIQTQSDVYLRKLFGGGGGPPRKVWVQLEGKQSFPWLQTCTGATWLLLWETCELGT